MGGRAQTKTKGFSHITKTKASMVTLSCEKCYYYIAFVGHYSDALLVASGVLNTSFGILLGFFMCG